MRFATLFLTLLGLAVSRAPGAGVLVYKEHHFHHDERAPAVRATWLQGDQHVVWFRTDEGRVRFERHEFFRFIEVPDALPAMMADKPVRDRLAAEQAGLERFSERFDQAAPLLAPAISMLSRAVARYDKGEVIHRGKWLSREDYDALLADEAEAVASAREESRRRAMQALEQREAQRRQDEEASREKENRAARERLERVRLLTSMIESLEEQQAELDARNREIVREMLRKIEEVERP